jgi:acetyl-CoA carboxylase/biotin carboxylase 1
MQELNFRSNPNVWGYFSMDSSGSIHEFANSQFGHLFASGPNREQARQNMVVALKELSIRGDISTTVDYIGKLIKHEDFVENKIDTSWLDRIIQEGGIKVTPMSKRTSRGGDLTMATGSGGAANDDTLVVIGATVVADDQCAGDEGTFLELFERRQLPSLSLRRMIRDVQLKLDGVKYKLRCTRTGSGEFRISVAGGTAKSVSSTVRMLSGGGHLISTDGKSQVAYQTSRAESAGGMRLSVGGRTISLSPDYDPSSLRTDVAGKLVKKLTPDGAHVKKGGAYAEIVVMKKIFMPLKVEESGIILWAANEGVALAAGDLLATLELDNPDNVSAATVFRGDLDVSGWGTLDAPTTASSSNGGRPHIAPKEAMSRLGNGMAGCVLSPGAIDKIMKDIAFAVTDLSLPAYEIDEQLYVLNGRIDGALIGDLSAMTSVKGESKFPADQFKHFIAVHMGNIKDEAKQASFLALTAPIIDAVNPYTKWLSDNVPGAERVLIHFLYVLREWISVEPWCCDGISYTDAVDNLRKTNKNNNTAATRKELDQVHGQDPKICSALHTLMGRRKNNPCLMAEPGMGKIAEGVAQILTALTMLDHLDELFDRRTLVGNIAVDDFGGGYGDDGNIFVRVDRVDRVRKLVWLCPVRLRNHRVVLLELVNLVAGMKYRGEFEEQLQAIVEEVTDEIAPPTNLLIHGE